MLTFKELCEYAKINCEPMLEGFYTSWCKKTPEQPFVKKSFVLECAKRFALPDAQAQRLVGAIDEIEADAKLLRLSLFLRDDMCAARHRCDLDDYRAMQPEIMHENELYSFVLLMACVEPSLARVKALNVPPELYEAIPFNPMKRQMEHFAQTKDGTVKDFPWDMNFYTCSIFLLDRFYFIPFKLDDDILVYKNIKSGETVTAFAKKIKYRADGQRSGVNGGNDFIGETVYDESTQAVTLTPINPCGIIEKGERTLQKNEWELVLKRGDIMLGLHIPGGEGYNPEHLHKSVCLAKSFFEAYFPEIPFKAFGSESWLYDPHLRLMLSQESNIVQMQNKMYIYPLESGDDMIFSELFGGEKMHEELKEETTLQRNAKQYMKNGGRFTASGMFILAQDAEKILQAPYATPQNIQSTVKAMEVTR